MPCGAEHLRHDVLDDHAFVYLDVVVENPVVDVCGGKFVFVEREADEQPRVAKVALERRPVHIEPQSYIRLASPVADIHGHRAFEPFECAIVVADACVFLEGRHGEFLFVLGKLGRYLAEY